MFKPLAYEVYIYKPFRLYVSHLININGYQSVLSNSCGFRYVTYKLR